MTQRGVFTSQRKTLKPPRLHVKSALSSASLLLAILSTYSMAGCGSSAQVEWESQSRTEMGRKIDTVVTNPNVSSQYKALTAQLNEEERSLVNRLLDLILAKDSTVIDVEALLETAILTVEHFALQSEIRDRLGEGLNLIIQLAEVSDATLQASLTASITADINQKFEYLQASLSLAEFALENVNFGKILDSQVPQIPHANLTETALIWAKLASEDDIKSQQMQTILGVAVFASESNFKSISSHLKVKAIQESLIPVLNKLNLSDSTSQDFLAVISLLDVSSYEDIAELIDSMNTPSASAAFKSALTSVIRKTAAVESLLRSDLIKALTKSVTETDAVVRLNRMTATTEVLQGSGFFDDVTFSNKRITNTEDLICTLVGKGLSSLQYSFKWTNGDSTTLADWSPPASGYSNTIGALSIGDTAQCLVRIFKSGVQMLELSGDLVTVESAPPEFESGFVPSVAEVSISKGAKLIHTAELATDPNPGDQVTYRLNKTGERGTAIQTSPTTFEYTHLPNFVGKDEFSYIACDQNNVCSSAKIVRVTVNQGNSRPIIYGIQANTSLSGNQVAVNSASKTITLNQGHNPVGLGEISLLLQDDELGFVNCSSVVTITSGDPAIEQNNATAIQIDGLFPNCKFSLTPIPSAFGLTELIVSVTDGIDPLPATDVFNLVVVN